MENVATAAISEVNEVNNGAVFHSAYLSISKTEKTPKENKRVFSHYLEYGFPTLNQVNPAFPEPDSWDKAKVTGGEEDKEFSTPVYLDKKLQYAQTALITSMQMLARNKDKQEGADIPMDWEGVFAVSSGDKFGTVFKLLKDTWTVWLEKGTDYSDAQCAALVGIMDLRILQGMDNTKKEKIHAVFNKFVAALQEPETVQSAITAVNSALAKEEADLSFL